MKYKKIILLIVSLVLSCMATSSFLNAEESFVTGKDWTKNMSKNEKFLAVVAPYILYHRYGVSFRKQPQEYISDIDKILMVNPYLEAEDVANIFASAVYTYEPESRPAFQAMARQFQYENLSHGEVVYPRLLLKPSSQDGTEAPSQ